MKSNEISPIRLLWLFLAVQAENSSNLTYLCTLTFAIPVFQQSIVPAHLRAIQTVAPCKSFQPESHQVVINVTK